MINLRKNFERFCLRNRDKGIPNLMLYVILGSAVVYLLCQFTGNTTLYEILRFDRTAILQGQVWRLITYVFTYQVTNNNFLIVAISLFCYYTLGRAMEATWGSLRFNLFYLSGVILMDVFAMCLGGIPARVTTEAGIMQVPISGTLEYLIYGDMVYYLHLSLLIGYATLYPNSHFLLFYIIPVKAWIFGLLDLVLTLYSVYELTFLVGDISLFPHNLFPLVAIANYFLIFGKDVVNLIPLSWRINAGRKFRKKAKPASQKPPIQFYTVSNSKAATEKASYNHRCTVCGRTDVSHPDLEFRYCSRCNGYHCYCEDHINNHTHIE